MLILNFIFENRKHVDGYIMYVHVIEYILQMSYLEMKVYLIAMEYHLKCYNDLNLPEWITMKDCL